MQTQGVIKTHICKRDNPWQGLSLERIYGNCLEGAGLFLPNKGYARIDKRISPEIGDLVWCNKIAGQIAGYIKQVKSIDKDSITVGTNYLDSSKDYTFVAEEILGVVTEVYDAILGKLIWRRPI